MINPTDGFTEKEMNEFIYRLGAMLFRLPAVSKYAGHQRPLDTVCYLDIYPSDGKANKAAKEFLIDLSRMKTNAMASKWHPCGDLAGKVASFVAASPPKPAAATDKTSSRPEREGGTRP